MSFGAISSECSMTFGPVECTTLPSTGVCMSLISDIRSMPFQRRRWRATVTQRGRRATTAALPDRPCIPGQKEILTGWRELSQQPHLLRPYSRLVSPPEYMDLTGFHNSNLRRLACGK